ncbi:MAG: penicillin-binding transpeptidase domain-containing protein, partial [Myxococcota bacterium]|nr:penicillin-binding transpeptidase domain-containing protein [Myxococcota bacterium]
MARLFTTTGKRSKDHDSYMHRKLRFLEYFYRMDQLRAHSIYGLVDTLAGIADKAVRTFDAQTDSLRFMRRRQRKYVKLAENLDDQTKALVETAKKRSREVARECRKQARKEGDKSSHCIDPLRTVRLSKEPKRYYPKREMGTQMIGLVGKDSQGTEGMERAANGLLTGGKYSTRAIRDTRGRRLLLEGIPEDMPLSAPSVELTIDQEIQAVAEQTLSRSCQASGARAGYAVVMDVATGEVLGAATYPSYNPNTHQSFLRTRLPLNDEQLAHEQKLKDLTWAEDWGLNQKAFPDDWNSVLLEARRALTREQSAYKEHAHAFPNPKRHGAFQYLYEPGSIMKVFTLAAWLESGIKPPDYQYPLKNGEWDLELPGDEEKVITDSHVLKGVKSAKAGLALKVSSNIIFGQMGLDLEDNATQGGLGLRQTLQRFGFGSITGSGFPGEAPGKVGEARKWQDVETITISFGQGIQTTGIQLVTALSALANGGKLMRPLLVRRVVDSDGEVLRKWEPTVIRQVVSPETARSVLDLMRGVVLPGGT